MSEQVGKEVYRVVLPDGQEFAWHSTLDDLRAEHPRARITGRLVMDATAQGSWADYEGEQPGPISYDSLTVAELRSVVEDRGLDVANGAKKADLVAALEAADAEGVTAPAPIVAPTEVEAGPSVETED